VTVFGLFEMPPIWPKNRAFSERLFFIHSVIGIARLCLVAAQIGAALYHHFVRRDHVLLRMLTSLKTEGDRPMPAQQSAKVRRAFVSVAHVV